jgi:peroxiredoxin (alkyl hydroperoxide reductase subunit C)
LKEFEKLNSVVLGVSTDSVPTHIAWAKTIGGINYPLLSDYNKDVSRMYDVLMDTEGIALRGTFIIDPEGILKYISINDTATGRSVNEFLRILAALQTKKACPAEWKQGDATL